MLLNQALGCAQGDAFTFTIALQPYADGTKPDLTGAAASWQLMTGNYSGAEVLINKTSAPHIFIDQDVNLNWRITVELDPEDTADLPRARYFHQCRVVMSGGVVSHIESGPFDLAFAGVP
jgi:hypothetical protein